jgi:endonuclease YncB( thermonuclease family)
MDSKVYKYGYLGIHKEVKYMSVRRTVRRVLDGNTFQTAKKVSGSSIIRIANFDAPEKYQFGGRQATARLKTPLYHDFRSKAIVSGTDLYSAPNYRYAFILYWC